MAEAVDDVLDILTAQLARAVVEEVAPQELPLFGPMSRAFLKRRERLDPSRLHWDEDLGFGVSEAVTLLTPAALAAAGAVVGYFAREGGQRLPKATAEVAAQQLKQRVQGLLGGKPGPTRLEAAQRAAVRQTVLATSRRLGVPKDKAALLADVVVGRLATPDDR